MRNIPDNNLAYPVFINIDNKYTGSGFFLNQINNKIYLITAKHVIFDNKTIKTKGKIATISCQSSDINSDELKQYRLDFETLAKNGKIIVHPTSDVATIEIFEITQFNVETNSHMFNLNDGVTIVRETSTGNTVSVNPNAVALFNEVLISNDIILYGYPSSLGLQGRPQFNYSKPLLRKGIVAGLNKPTKTIVLDCPSYFGNSGGPIVQIENHLDGRRTHMIIGVMSEFIPFEEQWINTKSGLLNTHVSNSGYSIAVSMDKVFEILKYTPPKKE
ncbi:hypothetical protein C1631_001640 [Chryseobacterium phosphatilyticum]|uniref:Serine protease n=1 Tax=Chryseobacterium phosphatilyticum TaxID=475075 RepID=A0A316XBY7_9FLAO|nr:trypsin-like peptidase domain-containing protein [Chryseobacterium phosphatilyticum]PWN71351.1 hypothetical protein C1631_001640 [Chryseobacterium phosphatilyticum]